jgi:hypothetical protein
MKDLIEQSKEVLIGETLNEGVSLELQRNIPSIIKKISAKIDQLEDDLIDIADDNAGTDVEREWLTDYFANRVDELFKRIQRDIKPKTLNQKLPRDNA